MRRTKIRRKEEEKIGKKNPGNHNLLVPQTCTDTQYPFSIIEKKQEEINADMSVS
jgi:hypothetical protein